MISTVNETSSRTCGNPKGPVLIFIHGLGLNKDLWQWQIPVFKSRFFLVTYDLWGHGNSLHPQEKPSLSLFSKQLRYLMDDKGFKKVTLIGFSLGGMIARRAVQDMPERVDRLIILNSPHERTPEAQAAIWERVEQARLEGSAATVEAALDRWFTETYRLAHPEKMGLIRSWILANKKSIYYKNYRVLADGIDEIISPNPPIECPTLVLTGDEDFGNGPEMANRIAADIKGSKVVILKRLRHMALIEDHNEVNRNLMDFLSTS